MKPLTLLPLPLLILLLLLLPALRAAGQEWRYDSARELMADRITFWHSAGNAFHHRISPEVKTPDGMNTLELSIRETAPEAPAHARQVNFLRREPVKPGTKYRLSFVYRGSVSDAISIVAAQAAPPFRPLAAGAGMTLPVEPEWREAKLEFTPVEEFAPPLATPRLMIGTYPVGGVLFLGPVRLEELSRVVPAAIGAEWRFSRDSAAGADAIPAGAETVVLKNGVADLSPEQAVPVRTAGWLYQVLDADEAGTVQIGMAADWWFECFVNGERVFDTLKEGNPTHRFLPEDNIFNFKVRKGRNLLAVKVLAGSGGWRFACGRVPFTENPGELRVVRIAAGEQFRPLDMEKTLIRPGTALDFSELNGKRHPAGTFGRVIANPEGRLAFERRPEEPVRFLAFNFVINYWRLNAHAWSKADIERFAEAVSNQGYNMIRIHFLDRYLLGWKVHFKPHRTLAEAGIPRTADAIEFDPGNLDRFDYLVKCFKERGIYLNLDLMSASTGYSMAYREKPEETFKARMFTDPLYRAHWRAAVEFLLSRVNPYTGTALKDEPALACVNFLNEQDLQLGAAARMEAFTVPFREFLRKKYGSDAALSAAWGEAAVIDTVPAIDETAFRQGGRRADDTGTFLRQSLAEMTGWYLAQTREIGYPGLVNFLDMIMRTMEIPVKAELPAIAQHSYFAHPNPTPTRNLVPKSPSAVYSGGKDSDMTIDQRSSLNSSYFRAAAMARFLDRPFLMTEYSHSAWNRYRHERGLYFGSYAALQGWDNLTSHQDTVRLSLDPMFTFEGASDPISRASETVAALVWLRGDVKEAPHTVAVRLESARLFPDNYLAAVGDDYAKLALLTKTGILFPEGGVRGRVKADREFIPATYSPLRVRQWYVSADNRDGGEFASLTEELRKSGILPPENRTDPEKRIFESETGELLLDGNAETMTVTAPRLEGAILKNNTPVKLDALEILSCDKPAGIVAASLEKDRTLREAGRVLLVVSTNAFNTGMCFEDATLRKCIDAGELPVLMESVKLELTLATGHRAAPAVYALHLDGSRAERIPAELRDGKTVLKLDTSKLTHGTPYFELAF